MEQKRSSTPPAKKRAHDEDNAAATAKSESQHEQAVDEFGGALGIASVMLLSHMFVFLLAASLYGTDPSIYVPTLKSVTCLLIFHTFQLLLAWTMPGVWVKGQSGLGYLCNGYCSFYTTIAGVVLLHVKGVFDLTSIIHDYPAFLTTAVLLADAYSVATHLIYAKGWRQRVSITDFFMGCEKHPRIGPIDVKLFFDVRMSFIPMFLLTLAAYIEASQKLGFLNPVLFMVFAHWLYMNAIAKGEHFIPYTFDINTEKFGWMLAWWNTAGVALVYSYQSLFLGRYAWGGLVLPVSATVYYSVLTVALVLCYWAWDEAQFQVKYFRMELRGEHLVERRLFPTFRHLKNPKYIKCERTGSTLLTDGWIGRARKIHYTLDLGNALIVSMSCGFGSVMPYTYFGFFLAMLTHRAWRDETRCRIKYGATWDKYIAAVPYRFIPGVF